MSPIAILQTALVTGLLQIGRKLLEAGSIALFDKVTDYLKEWLKGGFQHDQVDKQTMYHIVRNALEKCGAPDDEQELTLWFQQTGLNRLKGKHDHPLFRQLARSVIGFTRPDQAPPEDLVIALDWPIEKRNHLSTLLFHLHTGLADLNGWKDLLAFVKAAEERNLLRELLDRLAEIENILMQSQAGHALKIAVSEQGIAPQEAIQIERSYRRGLIHEYRKHAITGVAQVKKIVRLPLQDIYFEVSLLPFGNLPDASAGAADWQEAIKTNGRTNPAEVQQNKALLSKVLPVAQRLLIAGKPGSGKTITLKFITLMLALGQPGANRLGYRAPYLPLYVRLADYAAQLKKAPNLALETFLIEHIEKYYPSLPRQGEFLRLALQSGGCVILLDGLDEVGDIDDSDVRGQALRNQVLKQVQRFAVRRCASPETNRVIVTSRTEGYYRGSLSEFLEVELCGLESIKEIEAFLLRWFVAYEFETDHDLSYEIALRKVRRDRIDRLIPIISRWESIRRLAVNPLLLTILSIIHETGKRLPHRRVELYETVIKTMIESWRQAQTDHVSNLYHTLQTNDVYYLMSSLAYWLHEHQPGGTLREYEWQRKIEDLLAREGYREDNDLLARRFLRHAREETGLLTERSPGQIGFFHLTLEEYLAAVEMARKETDERTRMLEKHWADPRWQEVILLTAGVLNVRGSEAAHKNFIASLLWMEPSSPDLVGLPAVLAGKALLDLQPRKLAGSTYQTVVQTLKDTMQDVEPTTNLPDPHGKVPILTRAAAAEVLDELGWLPPDLYEFVYVPVPKGILDATEELPSYLSNLDGFYLGRYPVTNAQYQRFLEADDFADPDLWLGFPKFDELSCPMGHHWGDTGWQWYQNYQQHRAIESDGRVLPAFWRDPHFGSERRGLPVVGLSWFEANAYCRWLYKHWHLSNLAEARANPHIKPAEIRLPTEAEWLVAAGGGGQDTERFAWDRPGKVTRFENDILRRANIKESNIGHTTPVAMYPLGQSYPNKIWDMSGNVWEWQANYYSSTHLYLALRGGSWANTNEFSRLTGRLYNFGPSNRWKDRGFRVLILAYDG